MLSLRRMKHAALETLGPHRIVFGGHLGIGPFWRKTGLKSGPVLVVTGCGAGLDGAVRRLKALPSLGYMRGELTVSRLAFSCGADMYLQLSGLPEMESYWRILAAATRLGMISGRGVPARYLEPTIA